MHPKSVVTARYLVRRITDQVTDRSADVEDATFFVEFTEHVDRRVYDGAVAPLALREDLVGTLQFGDFGLDFVFLGLETA